MKQARELCWEIEKLPASEQQTKISQMASDLSRSLGESITTEEMLEIVESLVKLTSQRHVAKRIGISPEVLNVALKNRTVSNRIAEFFGYRKEVVYRKVSS